MDTLETIKQILWEKHQITSERVTESATLESLKLDSVDALELICELENQLEAELGDEIMSVKTIGELVQYIENQ